jgi:hypothetical protein
MECCLLNGGQVGKAMQMSSYHNVQKYILTVTRQAAGQAVI